MKVWKVILAALVIFAAGAVTGALSGRLKQQQAQPAISSTAPGHSRLRRDLLDRMQRLLYLTPEQRERIELVLRDNNERMKQLWESIAPQAQEEHRRVNERIRAELTPEQQRLFDEMLKSRSSYRAVEDRRRREDRPDVRPARRETPEKRSRDDRK